MDVDPQIETLGLPRHRRQELIVTGVGGVRRQPGRNSAVRRAVILLGERGRALYPGRALVAEDRPPQRRPGAGPLHRLGSLIHVEVVVGDRSHPGLDHLRETELHTPVDVVGAEVRLERPDVLVEPGGNVHILGQTAKEAHRHVGVGVDQPRHREHARARYHLGIFSRGVTASWLNGRDAVAADEDVLVTQHQAVVGGALKHVNFLDQQLTHARHCNPVGYRRRI
jgi:hypothetical protein